MVNVAEEGVLSAVGRTPLVRLRRVFPDLRCELYAKLEGCSPGGSIKDRPALEMIRAAVERGEIRSGTTIVESTSGNLGVGLAQVCSALGLRLICVVDPKTTQQNLAILRAYGAEVDLVEEPDPVTHEFLTARLNRVQRLREEIPNSFWPNQYACLENPRAHFNTMREIVEALAGRLDFLFATVSTCGTVRGCRDYVRQAGLSTRIFAVDAVGSVIFGGPRAKRLIPGHGAGVRADLYQDDLAERCIYVDDVECILGCRTLVRREGILAGGSSGAVLSGFAKLMHEIPTGARCALILPDRGERYLDTVYNEAWVADHFSDDPRLFPAALTA